MLHDVAPLLRLATHYFGDADHRLISLKLKQEVPAEGYATIVTAQRRARSTETHLPIGMKLSREYDATAKDIQREAQFSDLLLIEETTYHLLGGGYTTKKLLPPLPLACPVFIVPEGEEHVEQIVLVDDGDPITYQRIKYLACLFSELCSVTPTTLLIARSRNEYALTRDEKLWINYLKLHFAHLAVHRIEERSAHTLPAMLDYTKNALIVPPSCPFPSRLSQVLTPLTQFKLICG